MAYKFMIFLKECSMVMHAREIRGEPSTMIHLSAAPMGKSSEMPAGFLAEELSLRGKHFSSRQNF